MEPFNRKHLADLTTRARVHDAAANWYPLAPRESIQ
jgi:hypothetical protein